MPQGLHGARGRCFHALAVAERADSGDLNKLTVSSGCFICCAFTRQAVGGWSRCAAQTLLHIDLVPDSIGKQLDGCAEQMRLARKYQSGFDFLYLDAVSLCDCARGSLKLKEASTCTPRA